MKPSTCLAAVVIAVLATILIQEIRISKLRQDLIRLRELPRESPPATPAAGDESSAPGAGEPASTPDAASADPAISAPHVRSLPDDYPVPDEDRVKAIALGPYAGLHFQLGLGPIERAYLEDLIAKRTSAQQELAARWTAAADSERPELEAAMEQALEAGDVEIRAFLGDDFEAFASHREMQPEREAYTQLQTIMEQAGIALGIEKETKLIDALHQARVGTESIDWNSPAALELIRTGTATARFEKDWSLQQQALEGPLKLLFTEAELTAYMDATAQLKETQLAGIRATEEAIQGGE